MRTIILRPMNLFGHIGLWIFCQLGDFNCGCLHFPFDRSRHGPVHSLKLDTLDTQIQRPIPQVFDWFIAIITHDELPNDFRIDIVPLPFRFY